jgi:hypothetical protein
MVVHIRLCMSGFKEMNCDVDSFGCLALGDVKYRLKEQNIASKQQALTITY